MLTQTPSFRARGEHVEDPATATVRDWDEFLGFDASAGGLDGLVHSLDYGFQDAAAAPLVHDHHLASWRGEHPELLAHAYVKPEHGLMPSAPFHAAHGGQYAVSAAQQQLQFYRHQQQLQQQHRVDSVLLLASSKPGRQHRSHKRRADLCPPPQHFHVFSDAQPPSDAVDHAAIYACAPAAKPVAAAAATATHVGRWTKKEHELFLEGLKLYGRSWKKISSLVVTRTLVQIRTHAQKYLQKQSRAAQKLAAAAAAAAASDMSTGPSSSCASSSSSQSSSPTAAAAGHRSTHSTIDPSLALSTPTFASWRPSPLREQPFQPVAFPASMSSSGPPSAALAPTLSLALPCASSASPLSLAPLSSSSVGAHLVSSFKLDQLLQDEAAGACDDGEYDASPKDAPHRSALHGEQKAAQRTPRPVATPSQDRLKSPPKPSPRRTNAFPHVLSGHDLLHTFDDEYAGSLLPSPAIASTPRVDEYGSYCDWM